MLLDKGYNSRSKKINAQFEYAESVYQAQCEGALTIEMIKDFEFETDLGGFSCLASATNPEEIDDLCQFLLDLTENRRKVNSNIEKNVLEVLKLIKLAKEGESQSLIDSINAIHHIL